MQQYSAVSSILLQENRFSPLSQRAFFLLHTSARNMVIACAAELTASFARPPWRIVQNRPPPITPFSLDLLGSTAVNILVPVLVPVIFLLIPKFPNKTRPYAHGLVIKAVKEGQLFWVTIALCAVGYYQLYTYIRLRTGEAAHEVAIIGIIFLALINVVSMVLVVLQALEIPAPLPPPRRHVSERFDHGLLRTSIWLLLVTIAIVCGSHYVTASAVADAKLTSVHASRGSSR
jgi:hypothetical protein